MTMNTVSSFTITQDIVARYEQKIANKKKVPKLELFLEAFTASTTQFESNDVYKKFLKLISKTEFTSENLSSKSLVAFRNTLGLPTDCFETDVKLIARDTNEAIPCSKLLLTKLYPFFKSMFASQMKEAKDNQVNIQLSKTAIEAFITYLSTGKIGPISTLNELSELLDFAHMIIDAPLINQISEAIFVFLLDEKNEALFDPTPLKEHAQEFTRRYLEKKGIETESLERGGFGISLSSFAVLFTRKESKILDFIATKIDEISINQKDITPLFLLPRKYKQAILSIKAGPILDALSYKELEKLSGCFPNVWRIPRKEDELREILKTEPNAFIYSLLGKILSYKKK